MGTGDVGAKEDGGAETGAWELGGTAGGEETRTENYRTITIWTQLLLS